MSNVKDKTKAMHDFFNTYSYDIDGGLHDMGEHQLRDHLENDIFIGCASAATGICEKEFVELCGLRVFQSWSWS